jgi:hypothetical protein
MCYSSMLSSYASYRIQRTRIKRELDGRCENVTSAVKPHSHLTLQWKDQATFERAATVLNFPPTYVSAMYHASGHAELSRIIKTAQTHECIGKSHCSNKRLSSHQIGPQVSLHRIPTTTGTHGHLHSTSTLRPGLRPGFFVRSKRKGLTLMPSLTN